MGKRRAFVCWGYILWGITTAAFALFGNGQVGGDVGLAVTLFVVMDCVMSAIGSTANDSAFSAWVTDVTDVTNRGVVDIVLSIMPILALTVIFAGFDGMTVHGNRETGFLPRGAAVSKNFQKYFCAHALKKEVGALLWQNGNEITFRKTELAFLIRLFTGYLQLYPTHTNFCLLCSACAIPRGRILF